IAGAPGAGIAFRSRTMAAVLGSNCRSVLYAMVRASVRQLRERPGATHDRCLGKEAKIDCQTSSDPSRSNASETARDLRAASASKIAQSSALSDSDDI